MPIVEQAREYSAATPSDVTKFTQPTALFVGVAGDVAVMPWGGTTAVTFKNVPAGSFMPISCQQLMSTNTTATDIVLLTNEV